MSSIYINEFFDRNDRKKVLTVIDDLAKGDSLKHFKNKFIDNDYSSYGDEETNTKKSFHFNVNWKKRYESSNYMNTILSEYIDYVQPLRKTTDNNDMEEFDSNKKKILNVFFKNNDWDSFVKNCCYSRKKNGDVYIYWFITKDSETGIEYPKLMILDSKDVQIKLDSDLNITNYVYEKTIVYDEDLGNGQFTKKSKNISWVLSKGKVDIYEDNQLVDTIQNRNEFIKYIPIIHLQFLVDVNSKYSIIPAEDLIDTILRLDAIETDISSINHLMGYPQLIVIDGVIDSNSSGFGANSIVYVDTVIDKSASDDDRKKFQAKVMQMEIQNDLKSLYTEKDNKIEILYSKANLISPKTYLALAKSNSSEVINASRKDLEQELKSFYIEFADKFKNIFKILYKLNGIEEDDDITIQLPEYIVDPTIYNKYMLKAQKMGIGEMTITENLRSLGLTEKEINQHKKDLQDEYNKPKDDISFEKVDINLDNNFKKVSNINKVDTLPKTNDKNKK